MSYRPKIPDEIHERVEKATQGVRIYKNRIYVEAIEFIYSESGDKKKWMQHLEAYCEKHDKEKEDVLNTVIPQIFDEEGDAAIQFKERLKLNDFERR